MYVFIYIYIYIYILFPYAPMCILYSFLLSPMAFYPSFKHVGTPILKKLPTLISYVITVLTHIFLLLVTFLKKSLSIKYIDVYHYTPYMMSYKVHLVKVTQLRQPYFKY